jgi:hypothetical protein
MIASSHAFVRPHGIEYLPQEKGRHADDSLLISWLPETIQLEVLNMIQLGYRIPEEVLGFSEMAEVWVPPFPVSF